MDYIKKCENSSNMLNANIQVLGKMQKITIEFIDAFGLDTCLFLFVCEIKFEV